MATAEPKTVDRALEQLNDAFHDRYDHLREHSELDGPVMVVLADSLIVYRRAVPTERQFTAPSFHAIKSAAHTPVAAFLALRACGAGAIHAEATRALESIRDAARRGLAPIPGATVEAAAAAHRALRMSLALVEDALQAGRVPSLDAFAAESGPLLLELTEHATRAQLGALHAAVDEELAGMTRGERRTLQIVVAGDHQARVRSLGMQYFEKRLGEEPGEETRLTYAEAIDDPTEALALVGRKRLDRIIARAFFGDEKRLQRDVLGDAAATLLSATELAPMDP